MTRRIEGSPMPRTTGGLIKYLMAAADVVSGNIALIIALLLTNGNNLSDQSIKLTFLLLNVAMIPTVIYLTRKVHTSRGLYMDRVVGRSFVAVGIHAITFLALLWFLDFNMLTYRFVWVLYLLLGVLLPAEVVTSRLVLKWYRRGGGNSVRAIIIGTGETGRRLAYEMSSDEGFGYHVVGFVDDVAPDAQQPPLPAPFIGDMKALEEFLGSHYVHQIYFTKSTDRLHMMDETIRIADDHMSQFYFVPSLGRWASRKFYLSNRGKALPVLSFRSNPLASPLNRVIKRTFDIVFSSLVLVCMPIVFIPVAIGIKMSSQGPIFFKQRRSGYMGHEFDCWKFRSMKVNSSSNSSQTSRNDPRITKFGSFIRRTNIDELPQFWNVLKGDMSVVGPRPNMVSLTEYYTGVIDKYMLRHTVKPGLTGWAQVNGSRGAMDEVWQMEERIKHDMWYISHWTFLLDMKIIVRTIYNTLSGKDYNAY